MSSSFHHKKKRRSLNCSNDFSPTTRTKSFVCICILIIRIDGRFGLSSSVLTGPLLLIDGDYEAVVFSWGICSRDEVAFTVLELAIWTWPGTGSWNSARKPIARDDRGRVQKIHQFERWVCGSQTARAYGSAIRSKQAHDDDSTIWDDQARSKPESS